MIGINDKTHSTPCIDFEDLEICSLVLSLEEPELDFLEKGKE